MAMMRMAIARLSDVKDILVHSKEPMLENRISSLLTDLKIALENSEENNVLS